MCPRAGVSWRRAYTVCLGAYASFRSWAIGLQVPYKFRQFFNLKLGCACKVT